MTFNKIQRIWAASFGMLVLATLSTGVPAQAQAPWAEPFLRVMSDLRAARAYVAADPRPQNGNEKNHEINEITAAIQDIKAAAIDDGKDINFNAPTDSQGMAAGPLHEAIRLLRKAHDDCANTIDVPNQAGLKVRAMRHIDEAKATLLRFLNESGTM